MITLTKEKIYQSTFSLKTTNSESDDVSEISAQDIVNHLMEEVEFGEDLTFKELFDLIIINKDMFNVLYKPLMNGAVIEDFIQEYSEGITMVNKDLDYKLRISWETQILDTEEKSYYYDFTIFDAWGILDKELYPHPGPIQLFLISPAELKDQKIFIDNSYEIREPNSYDEGENVLIEVSHKAFSLYDVLGSIIKEMFMFGGPKERNDKIKEVYGEEDFDVEALEQELSYPSPEETINTLLEKDYDDQKKQTFWDMLYRGGERSGKSDAQVIRETIMSIASGADISLFDMMQEYSEEDDYERAGRIKKILNEKEEGEDEME